jgi:hypothetical protein
VPRGIAPSLLKPLSTPVHKTLMKAEAEGLFVSELLTDGQLLK